MLAGLTTAGAATAFLMRTPLLTALLVIDGRASVPAVAATADADTIPGKARAVFLDGGGRSISPANASAEPLVPALFLPYEEPVIPVVSGKHQFRLDLDWIGLC